MMCGDDRLDIGVFGFLASRPLKPERRLCVSLYTTASPTE